jgi:ABC-type transport system involved in cytochrome bd biosynthesis fused ATPase/permease subunit
VTSARVIGVLGVVLSLSLAIATGIALSKLAHHSTSTGLVLLSIVIAARWLLASALDEWGVWSARVVRRAWRERLISHLRIPRTEGERSRGDLALAIDQVATGPSLETLATSARVSVVGLVIVFWAAGWLSTLIAVTLMALAIPLYQRAGRRSEVLAQDYQRRRALLTVRQLELLNHAPELRALGAVNYGADEIAAISDSEHTIAMRALRVALESSLVTEFLSGVSIGLVAMVVGFRLLEGHLSLEHALVAVLVTSEIFFSIRRFGVEFHRREDAQTSLATLVVPVTTPASPPDALLVAEHLVTGAGTTRFDFRVRRGERVLINGPSGSGKTTLLHTVLGWREPASGRGARADVAIGFVSVESSLVAGTLYENLALGHPIPRERVRALLTKLDLTSARFADLDLVLLADGRGFSTGEKVRLALARCLLAEPALLILDDIAGVLDTRARASLREYLMNLEDVAVVEATVNDPLLTAPYELIEVGT